MSQGRIIKALAGFYYVEDDHQIIQCRARGKFRKDEIKPLVGDFVEYEVEGDNDGYVMNVLPRHNCLVRPPICNVDQALIVSSCKEPDFSSILLDKFLLVIEHLGIEPIIIISKMDLDEDESVKQYVKDYRHGVSVVNGYGGYSKNPMSLLHTVVSAYEVQDIVQLMHESDEKAIINVIPTENFFGGFYQRPIE